MKSFILAAFLLTSSLLLSGCYVGFGPGHEHREHRGW